MKLLDKVDTMVCQYVLYSSGLSDIEDFGIPTLQFLGAIRIMQA